MAKKRGFKAWLLTWEHIGDHAKPPGRIAAIINSRWPASKVLEIVELLYINATSSPGEKLLYAAGRHNPFPAQFQQIKGVILECEVICGSNPYLRARRVENLRYEGDGSTEDQLVWTDRTPTIIKQIREDIHRRSERS